MICSVHYRMGTPHNIASTPLQLTCTPIVSSSIRSDVSPITDEDSFINRQQTSIPKWYNLYCIYYKINNIIRDVLSYAGPVT